ncbi:MAG: LPS export ABC transporter periplasmic protein LptC [Candidatus Omnitrophota bacterium]|jgi:LPS export ABC transporter protein LptC
MTYKGVLAVFLLLALLAAADAQDTPEAKQQDVPQQINDFSISGYGEKGRKSWDVSGKSADILDDKVNLKEVKGNLYGEDDNVSLTADKGVFHREAGVVHLEDNVFITTTSGVTLTTDSLDWDRKNQQVATPDEVNIERENMIANALGASGRPELSQVTLKKNVKAEITPDNPGAAAEDKVKVVVTCDGPLDIDYAKNVAVFKNNVKIDRPDAQIYSDEMTVYFSRRAGAAKSGKDINGSLEKIVARGNVKVVRGENISYSEEAVYNASDGRIVLSGKPKLIINSTGNMNAPSGN